MKTLIAAFAVVLLVACSKELARSEGAADAGGAAQTPSSARLAQPATAAAPMPRMIVRKAQMRITVADTSRAIEAVTRAVEGQGGYVSGSRVWRDGELLRATLSLRVPSEKLAATLAQIRGAAKRVEQETLSSEDVAAEYVDLESRVRNLEATEEELRQLLVTARQTSRRATDVLEVHQQLMTIRGEIEQVKGRMRYLSQVTALSSIDLELTPDAIAQPVVEPGWQPLVVAKNAVRALVTVMQSLANAAIWIVIYVLPLAALFVLLAYAMWKGARRVRVRA